MAAADRAMCVLLFLVGWMSGGGILAMLTMTLLHALGVTGLNDSFIAGCLWGTWGVFMGLWMAFHYLETARQEVPRG